MTLPPLRLTAGFHRDIPAPDYHADPAPEPSLSSTIAKTIIDQSALHAWYKHPRLSPPQEESDPTRPKEIGSAAHRLILGRGDKLVVIDANDYKGGAAKATRAAAYASGDSPVLRPDLDKADAMAKALFDQASEIEGCEAFGKDAAQFAESSELVAIAQDPSGIWLRIMIDRFEDRGDHAIIWDVKSGEQSASPAGLGRRISNMSMEVQAALYIHVVSLLRPDLAGRIRFRWLFVENDEPHLIMPAELDAVGMEIGRRKMKAAMMIWQQCLATGVWPGYPAGIVRAEFPMWAAGAWEQRELDDPMLAGVDYSGAPEQARRPIQTMTEMA